MLYLIPYSIAFFLTSMVYIILFGSKKREFPFFGEKFHEIPTNQIRLLKVIPLLIVIFFVIFTAPRYDYFFILVIIAFTFTFLGDLGMVINQFLGLALYLITHLLLATAFITQTIQTSSKLIGTYILLGVGILFYLITITSLFQFLKLNLKDKYNRTTLIILTVFLYLGTVFFHITTASIFVLNNHINNNGIIIIIIGAISFLVSDIMIFIREASAKQKYSVLLIMSTYHIALFCISLITQFY